MKLITKKCPNCGANLSFDEEDKIVTCEYCKQKILIEREKNFSSDLGDEVFKLQVKQFHKISKINTLVIFFVAGIIIVITAICMISFFSINTHINKFFDNDLNSEFEKEDFPVIPDISNKNEIEDISQLKGKSLETLKKDSLKELEEWTYSLQATNNKKWEYVGLYLLKPKISGKNEIYLVYKKIYTVDNNEKKYYGAVSYSGLEIDDSGNVIYNDIGFIYAPTKFIDEGTVHGYESNKDLYEKVIKLHTKDYEIVATDGMYIELQK